MSAARYAEKTTVSSSASRIDIDDVLTRHGADRVAVITESGRAGVMFEMRGRRIRFELRLPDRRDPQFTHTPSKGLRRSDGAAAEAYEQAVRQSWRALYLVIRARLEAIEAGIETFEEAFLAHVVLPSGETVGDLTAPAIARAYADPDHPMPELLPGSTR